MPHLRAYANGDWAECLDTRQSTTRWDGVCSWVVLLFYGNVKSSQQFQNHLQRHNTDLCPLQAVKSSGFNVFFKNLVCLFLG